MSRSLPEDQDIDDPLDPPEAIPSSLARPAFLAPFGPSPWFKSLTYTLTRIRNISNRDKKVEVLASFIKKWKMYYGLDFYPAMRLFIPDRDKERAVYGIKEQALARVYCEILNLDPKTSDAGRRLMGWKQPTGQDHRVSGDFASVLYEVLKDRTAVSETRISVDEVNDLLDRLSQANTVEARKPIFAEFLKKLEAQDHEWLARIILKDLKISVREKFILDTFHPDAMALFNVCSDLKRVCYTLPDVTKRLPSDESAITLGRAIIPMLSARAIPDFVKTAKMMGPSFIIEEKIDGERMQIHKCGNEFRYWSRKGKDYTDHYGRYVNSDKASLTPWIADLFRADVADCILDGEMLAYDPESDRCLPFGSLKTAALNVGGEEDDPHPCFKVFDILFIRGTASAKGQSLARIPLWRRKVFLEGGFDKESQTTTEGVVREQKGRLEFPYRRNAASTADHIRLELDRVMDMKGEGLVLKQDDGLYHCGERAPAWTKIKPDYFDELGETFDLQVLGGYWGTGRRGGRVSSVLLGLRIDGEKDANGNDVYVTFAKAGGGFTLSDFQWMRDYHEDHWVTFDRKKPLTWPTFIRFSDRGVEDKPDVWIKPEHSFVIEVKGSEIVETVEFGLKQTIRFPRVKYIRYDLASKQKMNERENVNTEIYVNKEGLAISEWEELRSQSEQRRLDHRPGIDQMKRKRGSDVKKVQKKAKIPESFRGASVKDVELESQIFQLTTFYILQLVKVDGAPKPVKQYLEQLVVEHGGDFTQKADLNEDAREEGRALFIVASELHLRTNAHVKKAAFDIVTPEWIVDSIAQGRALPLFEKYLLFATERTKADAAYLADPDTFVDSEDESDYSGDEGGNDFHVGLGDDHEDGGDSGLDTATDGYEDEDEGIPDFPTASLPPRLGGTTGQINYNQNLIFQPLVIYLDTPDNSAENLLEDPDLDDIVITELKLYRAFIEAQGGVVTDRLDDPKLTHVVLATDDGERFGDISRRTSKPYRRQIVSLKWVKECLRQETLLAESGYRP